jgi:beta-galactosidase GanA
LLFVLNHTDQPATIDLPVPGHNLLTGKPVKAPLVLEPKGVAIVQFEKA